MLAWTCLPRGACSRRWPRLCDREGLPAHKRSRATVPATVRLHEIEKRNAKKQASTAHHCMAGCATHAAVVVLLACLANAPPAHGSSTALEERLLTAKRLQGAFAGRPQQQWRTRSYGGAIFRQPGRSGATYTARGELQSLCQPLASSSVCAGVMGEGAPVFVAPGLCQADVELQVVHSAAMAS